MPKKKSDFPEQIVVRLSVEQMTYLQNQADASGFKVSDLVRALIQVTMDNEHALINAEVDRAIAAIDGVVGEVPDAVGR